MLMYLVSTSLFIHRKSAIVLLETACCGRRQKPAGGPVSNRSVRAGPADGPVAADLVPADGPVSNFRPGSRCETRPGMVQVEVGSWQVTSNETVEMYFA